MDAVVGRLRAVLVGVARPYTRPHSRSAIDKRPVDGPVLANPLGLAGDEQGDLRVHGGPDKAVHCYPWSHYDGWRRELTGPVAAALLQAPGAFGENFSVETGLDEGDVCIADRWTVGHALFEVSQGRQPCWKLNDRFEVPGMAQRVQHSGRTGWYLRVLEPGRVSPGDAIRRVARPHGDWPLARLLRVIAERDRDPRTLAAILELPLPSSWHKLFRARLESGRIESWQRRLEGDAAPQDQAASSSSAGPKNS